MKTTNLFLVIFISIAVAACGGGGGTSVGDSAITATATTTAQSLTVDTAMTSFTPLSASGGTTPYTYSHTGTLPTGLSLDASTGAVTGTPTDTYPTASIVFSVKDANNVVASTTSTVSFTVAAAAILPAGYVSQGGLTWMPVTIQDTWANANAYCANTTINGQTGWRMPTQTELGALYAAYPDNSGVGSGNSTLIGQGWSLGVTWTTTLYSAGSHYGFYLPNGNDDWYNDTGTLYVSCVRDGGAAAITFYNLSGVTANGVTLGGSLNKPVTISATQSIDGKAHTYYYWGSYVSSAYDKVDHDRLAACRTSSTPSNPPLNCRFK